jgi:hypothetical protein
VAEARSAPDWRHIAAVTAESRDDVTAADRPAKTRDPTQLVGVRPIAGTQPLGQLGPRLLSCAMRRGWLGHECA